jgi:hypothetical protein
MNGFGQILVELKGIKASTDEVHGWLFQTG